MSSTAIKDVTRALQALLLSQLSTVSATAQVSLLPPGEALPSGLGVNLYLYRIIESPFTRNQPWAGDRKTPPSPQTPLGLELSYLLTPFAPAPDPSASSGDDAHTLLGAAMLALHENPILNDAHIPGFDADSVLSPELLDSFEQIKIRLSTTTLEELSKIWATINQPYRLSVAYEVALVQLTPDAKPPLNAGTVVTTNLQVLPLSLPRINSLTPAVGALGHVDGAGVLIPNPLVIAGSGLTFPSQTTSAQFGETAMPLASSPAPAATTITASLPLDAQGPDTSVSVAVAGRVSVPVRFEIDPRLDRITPLRTALEPGSGPPAPLLVLQGRGFTNNPQGVRLDGPGGTSNVTSFVGPAADGQLTITLPGALANGVYQVRVVLRGPANSVTNSRALEVIPLLSPAVALTVESVAGKQVHRLAMSGARLNGGGVRVVLDGVSHAAGANASAASLTFTLGRLLDAGLHTVAAMVDGSSSHLVTFHV